jgi:hypothetical protein
LGRAGQACAGTNKKELTTCGKKWRQEEGKRGRQIYKKGAYATIGG